MIRKLGGFLSHLGALFFSAEESIDYARQDETVKEMVDWARSKGGFFHPNLEIRRWNHSDPTSYFGVFLNESVPKDQLLMKIPGDIKIQLHPDYFQNSSVVDEVVCELAWQLKNESDAGSNSSYAPYVNYIQAQSKKQIPAMWSGPGKKLLAKVQDEMDLDLRDLNADEDDGDHFYNWITDWYGGANCTYCNETNQVLDEWYLAISQQRGFDYALIPIYDMINHDPGNVNTITRPSIYHPDGFGVYALRDMEAGEELLYNYYDHPDNKRCPTCGTSLSYWGTPEIIRDFGFVEAYPHTYHFYDDEVSIALIVDQDRTDGSYKVSCKNKCPTAEIIQNHYKKLLPMLENDILPLKGKLPPNEYFTIRMYYEALTNDFQHYLDDPASASITTIKYDTPPKFIAAPEKKQKRHAEL